MELTGSEAKEIWASGSTWLRRGEWTIWITPSMTCQAQVHHVLHQSEDHDMMLAWIVLIVLRPYMLAPSWKVCKGFMP